MWRAVPDGPHLKRSARFNPSALKIIFQSKKFRASAFGYFGHMWELYAFWTFVPLILGGVVSVHPGFNVSFWSLGGSVKQGRQIKTGDPKAPGMNSKG